MTYELQWRWLPRLRTRRGQHRNSCILNELWNDIMLTGTELFSTNIGGSHEELEDLRLYSASQFDKTSVTWHNYAWSDWIVLKLQPVLPMSLWNQAKLIPKRKTLSRNGISVNKQKIRDETVSPQKLECYILDVNKCLFQLVPVLQYSPRLSEEKVAQKWIFAVTNRPQQTVSPLLLETKCLF